MEIMHVVIFEALAYFVFLYHIAHNHGHSDVQRNEKSDAHEDRDKNLYCEEATLLLISHYQSSEKSVCRGM